MSRPGSQNLFEQTKTLVKSVFTDVWNEFYSRENYEQEIASLSCVRATANHSSRHPSTRLNVIISEEDDLHDGQPALEILDYSDSPETPPKSTISQPIIIPLDPNIIQPCPPYESCSPCNRNVCHGDDSNYMSFLPFADDPTFNQADHMDEYDYLEWQRYSNFDPNSESWFP